MHKRLLFSLSSLLSITVITPIFFAVSCVSETPLNTVNLIITAKQSPQLTNEEITILEGNDSVNQLVVLQKLFEGEGLTTENQANFSVAVDKEKSIVTLSAKTGYTISQKEMLSSNKYSIIVENKDLNITVNTVIQELAAYEVDSMKGTNPNTQLAILKKLFNGITLENQNKFKVSTSDKNVVTLTGENGYTFLGKETIETTFTLQSTLDIDLTITIKTNPLITREDVNILKGTEVNKQLIVLNKLFNGIDKDNQNKFTFSINDDNKIILTANKGYLLSKKSKIENYFTVEPAVTDQDINVTLKPSQSLLGVDLVNLVGINPTKQLVVLNKLFTGITNINQKNIIPIIGKDNVITLLAKEGFKFGKTTYLNSNKFTIKNTIVNITPVNTSIAIKNSEAYLLSSYSGGELDSNQLSILLKLFTGIDNINNEYFTFSTKDKIVTLIAKPGFVFKDGKNTIEAPPFTIKPPIAPIPD
ncbi:MAG: hypothetical protein ACRCRP_00495 [Metamycoplasmataceae bacterium]